VLFLDGEAHGLIFREWCHPSLAVPLIYAFEQLREGAGTLQVALDGLIQQLALGPALLVRPAAQLFQKLGAYLCLHTIDLLWRHSVYRLYLRLGVLRSVHPTFLRKAARFDREGIDSLFDSAGAKGRELPSVVRRMIVELKAEYPSVSLGELATICYVRIGRRPGKHTIEGVLSEEPVPLRMLRRFARVGL
jgi:hypothetical protein